MGRHIVSKKVDSGVDTLSPVDLRMIRYVMEDGLHLGDAYKKCHPNTKMGKDNCRRKGWEFWKEIKRKAGSWTDLFEMYNVGPHRMVKVFDKALEAKATIIKGDRAIQVEDHRTQVMAAKELKDIFGMSEQKVNVKIDKPLPLIVVTSDDDIPEY